MKDIFNDVLSLVKKGYTIQIACAKLGHNSTAWFYKNLTDIQKKQLKMAKLSNGAYSVCARKGTGISVRKEHYAIQAFIGE